MTLPRLRNSLLLEVVLLILFVYGYYRWTIEWRLNGAIVRGEVTDTYRNADGSGFLVYLYHVDGATYTRAHRIRDSFYEGVRVGQEIEVIYSPADVSVSGIPGQGGGDFDVPCIPGTFFDVRFVAYALPVLTLLNLVGIIGLTIAVIRRQKTVK